MDFSTCYGTCPFILMEGAVGERLKREYNISFDEDVAMAGLVYDVKAREALTRLYSEYARIAEKNRLPFMATTPTRRANRERVSKSRYNKDIIQDNIGLLKEIQGKVQTPMFVGGLMGCKGDAYRATEVLTKEEAWRFHSWQADLFRQAGVDYLFAGIMPALSESIGMAKAMEATGLPYIISFMIRKDGRLIDGSTIHQAILEIDEATQQKPLCYMTNCVHPIVLREALSCSSNQTALVRERFHGIQANTSSLSPEELDRSADLHSADCIGLADDMMGLFNCMSPKIMGGCCGTDASHMNEIAQRLRNLS